MPWTTPKTWISEVLTSDDMNTYLSDNTQYLYDEVTYSPAEYTYTRGSGTDYTTTSTSLVDIDATNLSTTLTTDGGDILVVFTGHASRPGGTPIQGVFAIVYDGTVRNAVTQYIDTGSSNVSFSYVFNGVSAGSHTFKMQWRLQASGATLTLEGLHLLFAVRELK